VVSCASNLSLFEHNPAAGTADGRSRGLAPHHPWVMLEERQVARTAHHEKPPGAGESAVVRDVVQFSSFALKRNRLSWSSGGPAAFHLIHLRREGAEVSSSA